MEGHVKLVADTLQHLQITKTGGRNIADTVLGIIYYNRDESSTQTIIRHVLSPHFCH